MDAFCRPTQELRGLGVANIIGSMFNCYTTTGSFSRSAVSADTGSKTQVFGIWGGEPCPCTYLQPRSVVLGLCPHELLS